jgi:hypothetical protein
MGSVGPSSLRFFKTKGAEIRRINKNKKADSFRNNANIRNHIQSIHRNSNPDHVDTNGNVKNYGEGFKSIVDVKSTKNENIHSNTNTLNVHDNFKPKQSYKKRPYQNDILTLTHENKKLKAADHSNSNHSQFSQGSGIYY